MIVVKLFGGFGGEVVEVLVRAFGVEPHHPLGGRQLDLVDIAPRALPADEFVLERPDGSPASALSRASPTELTEGPHRAFVAATFVRLLGIPIIVVAQPGRRVDPAHQMVHRLADHIVAAWPETFNEPTWLRTYRAKVSYVGGISRFDGRDRPPVSGLEHSHRPPQTGMTVLVLGGASDRFDTALDEYRSALPGSTWTTLGGMSGTWTSDPWQQICSADVVITHAGQGSIADVAAARRPAVVIPQPRPFDEQLVTAQVLQKHRLAVVAGPHSDLRAVPALVTHARDTDTQRWRRWQTDGAAGRAAAAIEVTAQRCKGVAS